MKATVVGASVTATLAVEVAVEEGKQLSYTIADLALSAAGSHFLEAGTLLLVDDC